MHSIGFLPRSSSMDESLAFKEQRDKDWYEYVRENDISYDDNLFHVSNPTHASVHKAALKYDVPCKDPFDAGEEIHSRAFCDLLNFFEPLKNSCKIIPLNEVEFNPEASVAFCGETFGVRTKEQMASKHWDYIKLFHRTAHLQNYPTLWKLFGKVEHLNSVKIDNGDVRSILTIPVELFFSLGSLSQDMNQKMCDPSFFTTTPSKHGINLLNGGFSNLFRDLEWASKVFFCIQGDCSKWDSRCMFFLLNICKQLRHFCWNKEDMSEEEWQARMAYAYDQIVNTRFQTSTGEVFQKWLGQPSGTNSTTDDNIIMHLYVLCYAWRLLFGRSLYHDHYQNVKMAIYADDHVFTLTQECESFCSFETRRRIYDTFGLILKLQDDFVSSSMEGHTFLGLTAQKHYGRWVPVFKRSRILNAIGRYAVGRPFTPEQKFDRASVFLLLSTFDRPAFDVIFKYLVKLRSKYSVLREKLLWTHVMCVSMWLGFESQIPPLRLDVHDDGLLTYDFAPLEDGRDKNIMSAKSLQQLKNGTITQSEYDARCKKKAQDIARHSGGNNNNKQPKRRASQNPPRKGGSVSQNQLATMYRPRFANGQGQRLPPGAIQTTASRPTYSLSSPALAYLKTLVDPANNMARIPDSYARRTAVFRSVNSFSVPISQDQYNKGRFSFCSKPIFGNTASPTQYQNAVVSASTLTSATTTWGQWTGWGDSTSYIGFNNTDGMGSDPRVDTNSPFLTSLPPSFWGVTFGTTVPDLGAGVLVSGVPANQTVAGDSTAPVINFDSPAAEGFLSGGIIILPFGDWNVSLIAKFQNVNTSEAWEAINFQATGADVAYVGITQQQTPVAASATTYVAAATVQVASSPGHNLLSLCLAHVQSGLTNTTPSAVVNQVSATYITISPANFTSTSVYSDAGVIQEVRPVAMAVLVTYMGTLLNNGGEIAINLLPSAAVNNNYFQTNNAGAGQYQFYENLRKTDSAYDGKIKDGAYCIWCPFDSTDSKMVSVGELNQGDYPAIVCSGVFAPDSTVNTTQPTLRVMTYTVWEFITTYTMFDTQKLIGSQAMVDEAQNSVKRAPFATANGKHLDYIKRMLGNAASWVNSNKSWIVPAMSAVGSLI